MFVAILQVEQTAAILAIISGLDLEQNLHPGNTRIQDISGRKVSLEIEALGAGYRFPASTTVLQALVLGKQACFLGMFFITSALHCLLTARGFLIRLIRNDVSKSALSCNMS